MANQIGTQAYDFQIFGDGTSTSVSFDIKNIPDGTANDKIELSTPDSIYLVAFVGGPVPVPNVTSIAVSGSTVTIEFDSALVAFNPISQDGLYELSFYLGFNA